MEPVDEELERLKRRRLLELQRRLLAEKREPEGTEEIEESSPEDVLGGCFVGRAWEVLRAARAQFPQVMPKVEEAIVEAIRSGRIRQRIDGESLFQFLRQIGIPVRLQTSIRYKEHGELKTIGQRLKEK
jgi:DNA-binding TFAR19-related protein (PDSD5 family)